MTEREIQFVFDRCELNFAFIRKLKLIVIHSFEKVVELLKLEASAIEQAAMRLEKEVVRRTIEILEECKSKVIVVGVGKSGIIAQKIAQTLTSTGTVAIFVHPSDALHGSLGVITEATFW